MGDFNISGVSATQYLDTMAFYRDAGVQLINESFVLTMVYPFPWDAGTVPNVPDDTFSARAVIADWHQRHFGPAVGPALTIVKAAGNATSVSPAHYFTACDGINTVCIGSSISGNQQIDLPRRHFYTGHGWRNPYASTGEPKEIERPDALAEGDNGPTLADALGGSEEWLPKPGYSPGGSSFSAPVVTGLFALMQGNCGSVWGLESALYRSILRTQMTWDITRAETALPLSHPPLTCTVISLDGGLPPAYPAPHLGCDHRGGAGIVTSQYLGTVDCLSPPPPPVVGTPVAGCSSNNPCSDVVNAYVGPMTLSTPPPWLSGLLSAAQEWYVLSTKSQPLRQAAGGYLRAWATALGQLWPRDTRLRATYSYYSCPASLTANAADLGVKNNLDLIVMGVPVIAPDGGVPGPLLLNASESLEDTNEGFDLILDRDYQYIEIGILGPAPGTLQACPDATGAPVQAEPGVLSVMYAQ